MAKIEYVHDEGNGTFCMCPDVTIAIPASDIRNKIDLQPNQIKHKCVNKRTMEVTKEVGTIIECDNM